MLAGANDKLDSGIGRQRLTSAARRAGIVREAMNLFAQNGFRGTTTREIAAAVGVSEPVLYQHFPSKSDLYTAIIDEMVADTCAEHENLLETADETVEEEVFFQWLGAQMVRWFQDDPRKIRLLLFSALEGHELADLWHERATQNLFGSVEKYLALRSGTKGNIAHDTKLAARAFLGMVAHYFLMGTLHANISLGKPEDVVRGFVDIYLNGIRRKPEPVSA
jgi:AcrR family transcriptional regulator